MFKMTLVHISQIWIDSQQPFQANKRLPGSNWNEIALNFLCSRAQSYQMFSADEAAVQPQGKGTAVLCTRELAVVGTHFDLHQCVIVHHQLAG